MNPAREASGNQDATAGRDIPWLQDVDENADGATDHWLVDWPYEYRDVVIVDASGVAKDSYNLTINSLEEPDSYSTLRRMLIDVATSAIDAKSDMFDVLSDAVTDLDVLANDGGSSRLNLVDVSTPSIGTAEIVAVEYPADLSPLENPFIDLVISEIVPGKYIELFNSSFVDSADLGSVEHVLVSGAFNTQIASLSDATVLPRDYQQMDWPDGLDVDDAGGELILYSHDRVGFDVGHTMLDFVAWGQLPEGTRIDLARQLGKWEDEPDGTLDEGAIQRIPGTGGIEAHAYDNHRPSTPGNAINDAVGIRQIIRYTAPDDFSGPVTLTYTVADDQAASDSAQVVVAVGETPSPWQNPANKFDVNNDGVVTPADVLAVTLVLNAGMHTLPMTPQVPMAPVPFYDCSGNNSVEPRDVLLIIHELNRISADDSLAAQASSEPPPNDGEGVEADTMASSLLQPTADVAGPSALAVSSPTRMVTDDEWALWAASHQFADDDRDRQWFSHAAVPRLNSGAIRPGPFRTNQPSTAQCKR